MNTENTRIKFIDYLNIFSCIAVIALHCNGCFWRFSYEKYWITSVFIECIFYFAVPIFFMISGVNLIDYREKYNTITYFKKRFSKIFVPFLCWSIIWIIITKQYVGKDFIDIFSIIINGKAIGVYWFFVPLFAAYFCIPILGLIDKNKRKKAYTYIVLLSLIFVSTLPMLFKLLNIKYNYGLTPPISSGCIIYILLGYLLVNCYHLTLKQRKIIYCMGIVGLMTRLLTVLFWSLEAGEIVNTMGGVYNIPTVLYSIAVFVFFQYDIEKHIHMERLKNFNFSKFAGYSFGIYLSHIFFVRGLPKLLAFSEYSIWWRTLGVVAVYGLCVLFVMFLKRLPYFKRIV